ncbi:helix-turn-helix domain-containing protein [Streptomyces tricolor]
MRPTPPPRAGGTPGGPARCGFPGPSHFARRFRAAYGLTPREWRRQAGSEPGGRPEPPLDQR